MTFSTNDDLIAFLNEKAMEKLKNFNAKITPTSTKIMGVTIPVLRGIAKTSAKDLSSFLSILKDEYFEEIMLYGLAIGYANICFNERIELVKKYVEKADNWAHVDCAVATFKFINVHKKEFLPTIEEFLFSNAEFVVRTGLVCLLDYYLSEEYLSYIFSVIEKISTKKYYVSMAVAWLISVSYVKFPMETEKYIKTSNLDADTYNRAIQKICDSYRVDKPVKEYFKKLKRKK